MTEDSKYVLRHEFERKHETLRDKIDDVDKKHDSQYNLLEKRLERQTWVLENTYDSQKKSEGHLEKISESLGDMGGRVKHLEYQSDTNKHELNKLKGRLDEEQKGNRDMTIAWIGIVGIALPPLINWASTLFKV